MKALLASTTDPALAAGPEYEASAALWPDPFEAPGVPPPDVLLRLNDHPDEDPDLASQVLASVECRRALCAADAARRLAGARPAPGPLRPIAADLVLCASGAAPQPGEIWRVRNVAALFDGRRLVPRKTWAAPLALILSGRDATAAGPVCRAALCSVKELVDCEILEATPNIVFRDAGGRAYVLHPELERPVALCSLGVRVGAAAPEEWAVLREAAEAFRAGRAHPRLRPAGALTSTGRALYERLRAHAAWISATAAALAEAEAARAEKEEAARSFVSSVRDLLGGLLEELPMAAAGAGERRSAAVVHAGPLAALPAVLAGAGHAVAGTLRRILLDTYPRVGPGGAVSGRWVLDDPALAAEGTAFYLLDTKTGSVLGSGRISGQGILRIEKADAAALEAASEEHFLIVICPGCDPDVPLGV